MILLRVVLWIYMAYSLAIMILLPIVPSILLPIVLQSILQWGLHSEKSLLSALENLQIYALDLNSWKTIITTTKAKQLYLLLILW